MEYKERLADLEHEQWSHWTKYMIDNMHIGECVERWKGQTKTDYKDLSEKEKDSDRIWADKIMAINSIRIAQYCNIEEPTSFDLFKLFADLTGFDIDVFNKKLKNKLFKDKE